LYSYKSYAKHFIDAFEHSKAKELGWKALSVYYCASYPTYPDLLKECRSAMKKLGYNKPCAHGGVIFVKTAKVIGIMLTLELWHLRKKAKNYLNKGRIQKINYI
jgi:hypothetical protein